MAFRNNRNEKVETDQGCTTKGQSGNISGELGVEKMTLKERQARLRWYGHALRKDEGNKVKQTTKMEVRGTEAEGRPR